MNNKFDMMTVKELREYVKEHGYKISGVSKMKKSDLVTALINLEYDLNEEAEQKNLDEFVESISDDNEVFNGGMGLSEMVEVEECRNNNEEEEDGNKKIARRNATKAYNFIVGGLENTLSDYDEDSDEYKNAVRILHTNDGSIELLDWVYNECMTCEFDDGYCGCAGSAPKEMRFATKEFIYDVIENLMKKDGYWNERSDEEIDNQIKEDEEAVINGDQTHDEKMAEFLKNKNESQVIIKTGKRGTTKYCCPVCDMWTSVPRNFCYNCGLQINYDSEKYYEVYKNNNSSNPPKKVIKYKRGCKCPSCNNQIWIHSNFCGHCGQEVTK